MNKKKIVMIVVTAIASLVVSVVACILGLPNVPIAPFDFGWEEETPPTEVPPAAESGMTVTSACSVFSVSQRGDSNIYLLSA